MTAAEFNVMREALGLSEKWLERRTHYRAIKIREWERGEKPVPDNVAHYLYKLEKQLNIFLEAEFLNYKNTLESENLAGKVVLLHFRRDIYLWSFLPELAGFSITTYSHILARIKQKLMEQGIKTSIKYMEPEAYFGWLGSKPDTFSQRIEWAIALTAPLGMPSIKPPH